MYKKRFTIIVTATIFLCTAGYSYIHFFSNKMIDVKLVSSDAVVKSESLISNFLSDEKLADQAYANKVLEIVGKVKEVTFLNNRNTLILQGEDDDSGIICDMNSNQYETIAKLTRGQKVRVKGVCKGFLKDVIMLNCILINNVINE